MDQQCDVLSGFIKSEFQDVFGIDFVVGFAGDEGVAVSLPVLAVDFV